MMTAGFKLRPRGRARFLHLGPLAGWLCLAGCSGQVTAPPNEEASVETEPPAVPGGNPARPNPNTNPGPTPGPTPTQSACEGVTFDPGPNLIRRLAAWEYAAVVEGVFGVEVSATVSEGWPPVARLGGFSNAADAQVATLAHIQAFEALADSVTRQVPQQTLLQPCESAEPCARALVETWGPQLFRRGLQTEERDRLQGLVESAATELEGAQWLLRTLLQSGSFLYRVEVAPPGDDLAPVVGTELASRLSFLLWGQGPDAALIEAAERGDLDSEAGLRAQLERLLGDERAGDQLENFIEDWLGLASLARSNIRDLGVSEALIEDMKAETLGFARRLLFDQGQPFSALLTSTESILSGRLATWYGIPSQGEGPSVYELPSPRLGLLTQAAVLAQAAGEEASMIARGLYILENLLCQSVPSPDGIDTSDSGTVETLTLRDEAESRLARQVCAGCHASFEPLAFAFERFDGAGRYQLEDEEGHALRAEGSMTLQSGEQLSWTDAREFAEGLASTKALARCLVEKPLKFSLGRPLELSGSDLCVLEEIQSAFVAGGETYPALMEAIVLHPVFRTTRGLGD